MYMWKETKREGENKISQINKFKMYQRDKFLEASNILLFLFVWSFGPGWLNLHGL